MTIGKNVKRLRQNKGITQEQLGEALGMSGQAVSKWENGSALPDITVLPKLVHSFVKLTSLNQTLNSTTLLQTNPRRILWLRN